MNLLDYARNNGKTTKSSTMGALLLSMLPYGLIYKSDAVLWYSSNNGSAAVADLIRDGYINEYQRKGKSKKHPYTEKILGLTSKGLCYLAEVYGEDYPWLRHAAESIEPGEEISFRSSHCETTVSLILKVQSCNIFFNRSQIRTIYDRLRDDPYQALCAMWVLTSNTTMQDSFLCRLADALENWLRRVRPKPHQAYEEIDRGEFFDAIELRVPERNPYTTPGCLCDPADFRQDDDHGFYKTSYIGVHKTRARIFLVYRSRRDGAVWNGDSIMQHRVYLATQMRRLGLVQKAIQVPQSFPSIMLIDGTGDSVAEFKRVCLDNRNLRKKADKRIGRGAVSLHLLPITWDFIKMMWSFAPMSAEEKTFAAQMKSGLCYEWPELFHACPKDVEMDLRYKGMPCAFCMDMDAKIINRCLSRVTERVSPEQAGVKQYELERCRFAVVCFEWEVQYFLALFAGFDGILMVGIDPMSRTIAEHWTS